MCKYCEEPNDLAFSRRKDFSICVADRTLFINNENISNTDSLPIKYCPFCGEELKQVENF